MKPQMKREVAINVIHEIIRLISFYASPDAVEDFREFGYIEEISGIYYLRVDAHYDFTEVLAYVQNYGTD